MILWDWEPSVVIGCAALAIGYIALFRRRGLNRIGYWLAGVLLLLLDLVSPIDTLGDQYLFSAHVLQHFFLALVIPPLLLLGTPRWFAEAALRRPILATTERIFGQPPVSWLLGVGAMLAWHIPALFNTALANDTLHIAQHLSLLVTGVIFWWPIAGPLEPRNLQALSAVTYLFSACLCCSLLGAFLTFSPAGLYPAYLHPGDSLGVLPLLRDHWGLDPGSDQQLGGLMMWVPGCFVYLTGILTRVSRWYAEPGSAREHAA
ncbi:MAG TPA: cytochrome c oxidase assembly protein [Bryobacteraceae bacterium]|nr:cytochrome c oxidase assembly protein [Bryobacteraceae bacterium]